MPKVVFDNGTTVEFDRMPSPEDIEEVAAQLKIGATQEPKPEGFAMRTLKNVPGSAVEYGKNLASVFTSPVQTAKAVGKTALGAAQKLIPGQQEGEATFDAVRDMLKQRYGGLENIKKTIETDPIGALGDLSTVVTGAGGALGMTGKAGKIGALTRAGQAISKAGQAVEPLGLAIKGGKLAARGVGESLATAGGITTGAQVKSMREALHRPNEAIKSQMRGTSNQDDIVQAAQRGFEGLKQERATAYTEQLKKVSANKKQIDITPIKAEIHNQLQKFGVKQVVGKDGAITLDFSRSPINKQAANDIKEIVNDIDSWGTQVGDDTAIGLDILKRKLDDYYSDSSQARSFVQGMKSKVRGTIIKEVPEYQKLISDYEKASEQLKDIKSAFSVGGKAGTDTIIRKLTQALRQNFEFREKLAKELGVSGGGDLISMVAGNQLNPLEPRGLARLGAAGAMGAGAATMNPAFLVGLAASSPRLVGEFLVALGMGGRAIGNTMNAIYNPKAAQAAYQIGRIEKDKK